MGSRMNTNCFWFFPWGAFTWGKRAAAVLSSGRGKAGPHTAHAAGCTAPARSERASAPRRAGSGLSPPSQPESCRGPRRVPEKQSPRPDPRPVSGTSLGNRIFADVLTDLEEILLDLGLPSPRASVLTRERRGKFETQTQERWPRSRGRQWSVGATSPGAPRIASGHQKLGGGHAIDALCRESIF